MSSVAWRLNAERVALLGWSRAILLQLAHPLVAAGVADHSSFRDGGLEAARRLRQTVWSMLSLTFGGPAARQATIDRIKGIHRRVHGHLHSAAGPFAAGTPYSADDPELLLWVHATLLDSIPLVYDTLVTPLDSATRDQYCRDAMPVAQALGVPRSHLPDSWAALQAYLARTYASGCIVVTPTARDLCASVLAPPIPLVGPASAVNRLLTVGLLPAEVRTQYGLAWSDRDARAAGRWVRRLRTVRRVLPDRLALWRDARHHR